MSEKKQIFALGFFDGIHLGHAALLRTSRELADRYDCDAGVVTFENHPDGLVLGNPPALICTADDRQRLMKEQFHMDAVVTMPFDETLRNMQWQDFLSMLQQRYGGAGFVCGEDFRFGFRCEGTAEKLAQYCCQREIPCAVVPRQELHGIRISSSYIRSLIEAGNMEEAAQFLGRPYGISGTVVHGHQLGRRLGIPTANLLLPRSLAVPRLGVYICRAWVDGKAYPAVTNIGTRPTVGGAGITVEPWILDFEGNLYDRRITLEFYRFLRPEMKFPDLASLQRQIRENGDQTRAYFGSHPELTGPK